MEGISAEESQHVQFLLNQRVAKPVQGVVGIKDVIAVVVMRQDSHAAHIVVNVIIHVLMRCVKVQLVQNAITRLIAVQVVVIMVSVARKVMANLVPLIVSALSPVLLGVAGPV